MNNILKLTVIILFVSSIPVNAQTFLFERIDPPIVYDTIGPFIEIKNHSKLTNLTGNSFNITFNVTYNLPNLWAAGFCDWVQCHGPGETLATVSLPPGQDTFYVYFWPDSITPGTGYSTVTAKRSDNPSEQYTLTFGAGTYPVGIIQLSNVVKDFSLSQNYPNPFNPSTKINFSVPTGDYVDLRVYDILGREVKVLLSQYMTPGEYEVDFDAHNFASGMYYYRLKSKDNVAVKKMTLVK